LLRPPPISPPFPYTTLFRSSRLAGNNHQRLRIDDDDELSTQRHAVPYRDIASPSSDSHLHASVNGGQCPFRQRDDGYTALSLRIDRKSTRLNSSHVKISYAV